MAPKNTQPVQGRFSLDRIKEALVFKALGSKLYQPLRSFFGRMELRWGEDAETAYATLIDGQPVIVLGPAFFNTEVENEGEAAEVMLHEIMHHLFQHLRVAAELEAKGFSHQIQNLAMDAVINAFLHSVGCAGFMERYYSDKDEYAFLRPGSTEFRTSSQRLGREVSLEQVNHEKFHDFRRFYWQLYDLQVDLEESLEFFKENFPKPKGQKKTLGGPPGSGNPKQGKGAKGGKDQPQPSGGDPVRGEGSIFNPDEINKILEALGLKEASHVAKSNFAQVIKKITASANMPGPVRTGTTYSRRIPAKMSRRDMLNVERGRELFSRAEYHIREAWLFFDYSGSMEEYKKFAIDLAKSLGRSQVKVHPVIWANGIKEISLEQFLRGEIPNVGGGTDGEVVAKYMVDNNIPEAVIITDNWAGTITTRVSARVFVCLVKGGWKSGSFLDRSVFPHSQAYELEPGE